MEDIIKELKELNKETQYNVLNRAIRDLKREDFEAAYAEMIKENNNG